VPSGKTWGNLGTEKGEKGKEKYFSFYSDLLTFYLTAPYS